MEKKLATIFVKNHFRKNTIIITILLLIALVPFAISIIKQNAISIILSSLTLILVLITFIILEKTKKERIKEIEQRLKKKKST